VIVQRVWLRVALAAGAGLASLVVCFGVLVAMVWLFSNTTSSSGWAFGSSTSWPSLSFWMGLVILIIVAAAGLSLPARVLGAKRDHATNTALLSVLGIFAFVFFLFASLANPYVGVPLALMAIVATPLVGSLFAIREDYRHTIGLVRATMIAAVAIYCASLLAFWLVYAQNSSLPYYLAPVYVAASSWLVVPGIVAALRPG
jgi:uncharacterized membrane protein